jgi:THO complex subunit 1
MAVSNDTSSDVVAAQLKDILRRARTIKQSTTIYPPLPVSELVTNNEPLFTKIPGDNELHLIAFETAARSHFYRILVS